LQVAFAEITGKAGGSGAIVFGEGGVAVDRAPEALAQDELGVGDVEIGVKLRAGRALDAVVWPEGLLAVGRVDGVGERLEVVGAGKGDMACRVPVLGEDDVIEAGGQGVDAGDDFVAAGDGKGTAGQEVQLHVDDQESVGGTKRESHELLYEAGRCTGGGIGAFGGRQYPQKVICRSTLPRPFWRWLDFRLLGVAAMCALICWPLRSVAQDAGRAARLPDAPSSMLEAQAVPLVTGSVSGTVTDVSGAFVSGAQLTLSVNSLKKPLTAVSGSDGRFFITGVPAGKFNLTIEADGFATQTKAGALDAGEGYEIREIALPIAAVATQVDAMSVHEQAEEEIKVEEHQRLLGVVPNFYVAYNWNAAPLSTGQKYKLAAMNTIDPINIGIAGAIAGYQQANNDFIGYGQGAVGYAKRFGANFGDLAVGTFVGGAILPALLHQDPRYFYMGRGTVMHRFWYAMASAVICKGDNGKWQPNYSSIGGDVAAGAIANVYYPASDRDGASTVITQGLIGALSDGLGNVVQEFVFKRVTPHSPKYASTTP
jgi:hypothetical protein